MGQAQEQQPDTDALDAVSSSIPTSCSAYVDRIEGRHEVHLEAKDIDC